MFNKKYRAIGLGGTFDHFHAGHAKFLQTASQLADHVVIGVTDRQLTSHKPFADVIESYQERVQSVHTFCNAKKISHSVFKLQDIYGPTLENAKVQAVCVTPETESGAEKINELREKLQLRPLPVFISEYFLAENGQPLHAEFIRAGIMNREGRVYEHLLKKTLTLSPIQKEFFQKPQGKPVTSPSDFDSSTFKAVVGDVCLENFLTKHWPYNLGVFDHKEQRQTKPKEIIQKIQLDSKVNNQAGQISLQLVEALKLAIKNDHKHLFIEGEEDLAAVALVLLLPLNSAIYYGQPGEAMIEMIASEDLKNKFYQVLT